MENSLLKPVCARGLYVLVPRSPLFASHWSLFLPDSLDGAELSYGRRIHVSGDLLNGFALEIVRGYDIEKHIAVQNRCFLIGLVPNSYCLPPGEHSAQPNSRMDKDEDEGGGWVDKAILDRFERVVEKIPPPGPSLRHVDANEHAVTGTDPPKNPIETKDCQWWIKEIVKVLVDYDMVHAAGSLSPMENVLALPKH